MNFLRIFFISCLVITHVHGMEKKELLEESRKQTLILQQILQALNNLSFDFDLRKDEWGNSYKGSLEKKSSNDKAQGGC